MSLLHRNLIAFSQKSHIFNPANSQFLKSPNLLPRFPHCHCVKLVSSEYDKLTSFKARFSAPEAVTYDGAMQRERPDLEGLELDRVLIFLEILSLTSSAVVALGCAVSFSVLGSHKAVEVLVGSKFLAWQVVVLVGGIVIGAWIRRRQWRRICREERRVSGGEGLNLLGRVGKLEEDVRSSVTILRVLSRQVEKLGIRFRVTRKSLKEPIAETAALAQKNSEATRSLAAQEDVLEKELGEVQKVLMAMQEQQQKQLELILAIAKSGKLLCNKPNQDAKEKRTREAIPPTAEPIYAIDQMETQ